MKSIDRSATESWLPPPESPVASDHEIQVWRMNLDRPASEVQELRGVLSEDETARAARFVLTDTGRVLLSAGRLSGEFWGGTWG